MAAPQRLRQFQNEGLVFDLLDEGPLDGPVVVLLHGFPERSECWSGVVPRLTAAGFRVLAPDQRGYSPGARPKGARNYAMDRVVGDVLALADQAGAARFHVVGHDWGAGVAWALAAEHGDRVETLTALSVPHPRAFLAALPRGQILRSWYMLFFQLPWLPELLLTARGGRALRRVATRSTRMPDASADEAVAFLAEPGAATAAVNWYRGLRHSPRRPLGRVSRPTLFVWSDGDAAIGRASAELAERWVAGPYRFEVLEGVSHWIPEERPAQVAELVLAHLAEQAEASG